MRADVLSLHLFLEEDSARWPSSQQEDLAHEPYGAGLPARTAPRRPLDVASVLAQPRVQTAQLSSERAPRDQSRSMHVQGMRPSGRGYGRRHLGALGRWAPWGIETRERKHARAS